MNKNLLDKIGALALQRFAQIRALIEARFGSELVLTERAKIGLVTSAALIILAAWLGLNGWVGHIESGYHDTKFNLARLKAQVESGAWSERRNQSHVLKSVLEDRLWTAETPGLAEAGFERWIRDRLARNKVDAQQIQVRRVPLLHAAAGEEANNVLANLQRMTAKVVMPFDEAALVDFLADVSESNKVMTVDRLIVRAGRNARVEMDLSTFFRYHERTR
jgi:hypothetical protein